MSGLEEQDICFICLNPGANSRDHIVPLCLFTQPLPPDLLTLPAHSDCHNQTEEEYFRNIVSLRALKSNVIAGELWKTKALRSLIRNPSLQNRTLKSLHRKSDRYSNGGIYVGTGSAIKFEVKRFYPTLEKLVRGLYRHYFSRFLGIKTTFQWGIDEPLVGEKRQDFEDCVPGLKYPEVFDSKYGCYSNETTEWTLWFFCFYDSLLIRCLTISDLSQEEARSVAD